MINCGRYSAALHYIHDACKYYDGRIEYPGSFDIANSTDIRISYENCRALEAEIFLKMVPVTPEKYLPIMSSLAYSYLKHAVDNMADLGWQEGVDSYCHSY